MPNAALPQVLSSVRSDKGLLLASRGLLHRGLLEVPGVAALDAAKEETVKIVSQQKVAFALGAGLE